MPDTWHPDSSKRGRVPNMGFRHPNLGFISLPLSWWAVLGLATVVLILTALLKIESSRLESAQEMIKAFELAGEIAKQEADRKDRENLLRKTKADEAHKRAIAKLSA